MKESTGAEAGSGQDRVFSLRNTVSVKNIMGSIDLAITDASFTDPAQYAQLENDTVLALKVFVKNTGDSEVTISNTDFSVYRSDDVKAENYFSYDNGFEADGVNSGKKLKETIYFDVTQSESYEVLYTPMSDQEVTFHVRVN